MRLIYAIGLLMLAAVGAVALRRMRYEDLPHAEAVRRLDRLLPDDQKRRVA